MSGRRYISDDELQKLNISLSVTIPPDYVLISRVELEKLERQTRLGSWWTMEDLEEHTKMKSQWLKKYILYVPRFKQELKYFVNYPSSQGEKWRFQAIKMAQFLEDNFRSIFDQ